MEDPTAAEAASAVEKAEQLPTVRKGQVGHVWPVADARKAYGGKVSREEAIAAPILDVRIDDLHAVQGSVTLERLIKHVVDPNLAGRAGAQDPNGYPRDRPIVVESEGSLYVHDGHHRLLAQKLLGHETAKARVVRIVRHPMTVWAHADD